MSDVAQDLADFLRASPLGARAWIRGMGSSMWPLLAAGDGIEVERCLMTQLERGDIALLQSPTGGLTAHLVTGIAPLVTSSFLGAVDPPLEVIGKAVGLERSGIRLRLNRSTRFAVMALSRAARWLRWAKHRRTAR